jgi:hypothetical protein
MPDINQSGYKVKKTGDVRQSGTIAEGDGGTSRGATARAGTLASAKDGGGDDRQHWYPAYSHTGSPVGRTPQKFRPTTKGGKVRGAK